MKKSIPQIRQMNRVQYREMYGGYSFTLWDKKTGVFRKRFLKAGSYRYYVAMEFSRGRITYYSFLSEEKFQGKWRRDFLRVEYDRRGNPLSYEDHKGNCWEKRWQVPFVFGRRLHLLTGRAHSILKTIPILETTPPPKIAL